MAAANTALMGSDEKALKEERLESYLIEFWYRNKLRDGEVASNTRKVEGLALTFVHNEHSRGDGLIEGVDQVLLILGSLIRKLVNPLAKATNSRKKEVNKIADTVGLVEGEGIWV